MDRISGTRLFYLSCSFIKKSLTMKRYLTLLALLISFASFAKSVPAWDVPLIKSTTIKPAVPFADPYVKSYATYHTCELPCGNYALRVQVQFNKSVPVPYYAIVQVPGVWNNSGYYREFVIYFNQSQHYQSVDFPLDQNEEGYNTLSAVIDYGPQ